MFKVEGDRNTSKEFGEGCDVVSYPQQRKPCTTPLPKFFEVFLDPSAQTFQSTFTTEENFLKMSLLAIGKWELPKALLQLITKCASRQTTISPSCQPQAQRPQRHFCRIYLIISVAMPLLQQIIGQQISCMARSSEPHLNPVIQ